MENQLRILLGTGIVIILTDYLKIFGEETRKNKKIIRDFIKCILISLVIIIVFGIINFYFYKTHLFYNFSEKDLDQYAVVFAANTVFLMGLNSLLNWAERILTTFIYYNGKNKTNVNIIKNILRGCICLALFFVFALVASHSKYKIFKQDTTVQDLNGNEYLVKENSTFDFEYVKKDSEQESSSTSNYDSYNSIFQLKKNSKIKLLKGSILYPKEGKETSYSKDIENIKYIAKGIEIYSTTDSILPLEGDEIFTLLEDTNISLATQNENKFILEVQFEMICLAFTVVYFVKALYLFLILSAKGFKNSKDNEWKFSEHIAFFTSQTMTDENMYDMNSFKNDKDKRNYDNDISQIIKCEKGDIIIDSELYDATIVSDNNGKNRISSEFILLKLKDDNVSVEYILFIVNNFLKSVSERKLDKEGLINVLSNLKINLPWKSYQKMVGNEYKVYLQKMDQLERYYKDSIKE